MTVAIPEAAGAAERAGARAYRPRHARAAGRQSARRQPRRPALTTTASIRRPAPASTTVSTAAAGDPAAAAGTLRGRGQDQDPGRDRSGGGLVPGHGSYHRIVIAEFIATVLIIGASPFLIPRTSKSATPADVAKAAAKGADPLSLSGPLIRLTAACVVFFVLALLSSGPKTGRIAAAFGLLVMLGTLINATDMWTALGQAFSGKVPFTPATGLTAQNPFG